MEPQLENKSSAVLVLVIVGSLLVVIDITIVAVGLPGIQADLGGSPAGAQWVIVAYAVTMGAATQVVGTLSDRLGRRRVYLAGIVLFTASSLACGLAPTVLVLDLARGVQGIGGAILMANSLPLISHRYTGQRRNMAIATWSTAATAAGMIAPVLGGLLIQALDWRAMFLVNVPVGVLALVLTLRTLPPTPRPTGTRPPIDWTGAALLITSLGLANFALLRGDTVGWDSPQLIVQFGLATLLFTAFVLVQRRAPAPTVDLSLFRTPAYTGATLAVFMSRVLTIGGTVYLIQYLQGSLHLTPTESGLMLVPAAAAQAGAGLLAGKLQARLPPGPIIATGYALKAIAATWLALALTPTANPWLLAIPLLLWGLGGGIAGAPVMSVAINAVDARHAGMVGGTVTTLASIGAGSGTAILGTLYTAHTGPTPTDHTIATAASAVMLTSAALAILTTAVVLILISPQRTQDSTVDTRSEADT